MSTINRLSSVDALQAGDSIPVWDTSNGDTRKASLSTLLAFIEANFADPDYETRVLTPAADFFTVSAGNTGTSLWLIINPTDPFTTGTLQLPPATSAVNDQEITVVFTAAVSAFTITSVGATVLGAPTDIGIYDSFRVRYNASQLTWYTLDTTGDGSSTTASILRQDFAGNGVTTNFALAEVPPALGETLQIFIDGVYQERAGYSIVGATLVFSAAPPNGTVIEVLVWDALGGGTTTADLVTYSRNGSSPLTTVADELDRTTTANMTAYDLATTAAISQHSGVITGYIVRTNYFSSARTAGSGADHRYTGVTTFAKASTWPNADGYFYDFDGKQFAVVGSPVSVLWFGAVGDGVADDTAAIQSSCNGVVKVLRFPGNKTYKHISSITVPNNVSLIGDDNTPSVLQYTSAADGFGIVLGANCNVSGLTFKPAGVSPCVLRASGKSNINVLKNIFDFSIFTGVIPSTLSAAYAYGLYFEDCGNVLIDANKVISGWNDPTYNASTASLGNNVLRSFNVENTGQNQVKITNNIFDDVWSAIYLSNTNYADISFNTITNTADTAIFERCTSGVTRYKSINFNKLYNTGKGAIKVLDANNLTGKGHYAEVIGNTIVDYARFVHTEAIFCYNYFNGSAYVAAPLNETATYVTISKNQITNTISDSPTIAVTNCSNVVISDNICHVLFAGARDELFSQWSYNVLYTGNNVKNVNGDLYAYRSDKVTISNNQMEMEGCIKLEGGVSAGYTTKIIGNYLNNTIPAVDLPTTFGVLLTGAGSIVYGSLEIYNNTFKTLLPAEDGNGTGNKNMVATGTAANSDATHCDNNVIIFSNATKRQKTMFGDILNTSYYIGIRGSAKYNEGTLTLSVKPTSDRTDTDTILFTT